MSDAARKVAQQSGPLTKHAQEQWADRMPDAARGPGWALHRADRAHGMELHPHFYVHTDGTPTSIRVYHGETVDDDRYFAVLVEVDGTVTTTYRVSRVDRRPIRAYLRAIGREGGPHSE